MEKRRFYKLAQNPSQLNRDTLKELRNLTEDFPLFHAAWMLYLKNLKVLEDPEFNEVLKKAAPLLPDRKQLYRYLHAEIKPDEFTLDIDKNEKQARGYMLENPGNTASGESLIDKFLSASAGSIRLNMPPVENQSLPAENDIIARSTNEDDELVSETLADIYVRQKKYDKALETFKKLSLKYPEKNSYFATRIEEIENLKNT